MIQLEVLELAMYHLFEQYSVFKVLTKSQKSLFAVRVGIILTCVCDVKTFSEKF